MTANATWNVWNFRQSLVQALLNDGCHVTVLAPLDDAVDDLEAAGCRVLPIKIDAKGLNPIENLGLMYRFKRLFRAERPDIVLSYTVKNNLFGAMAARTLGIPFIPNVTGLGTAFLSSPLLEILVKTLYRRAFCKLPIVFYQNKDDRDLFIKNRLIRTDQARLLPGSGVDLTRFAAVPLPTEQLPSIFLMVARLLRDKGVFEFVQAARRIKTHHPEIRFQLLGATESDNRTAINAATVQRWVDEGVIEYLGTASDVRPCIAAASCVVLPSYREGAPRTLIEAAAMSRPLIATDVPGCRAVVDDEVSGLLCLPRSADSLAAAIERFLTLPHNTRVAMGQAGRTKMEREFDEIFVIRAYREAVAAVMRSSTKYANMLN